MSAPEYEPGPRLELRGSRVVLRTSEPADGPALRAIHATPEVAEWWGQPDADFPAGEFETTTPLTMLVEGEIVGFVQFAEEPDPAYRFASIDLFVAPQRHRQGLASDAIATLVDHLTREKGHHRVTIDPATDNEAAIRCYEKAGFECVGVIRSQWRDSVSGQWRDGLLMDLVLPT